MTAQPALDDRWTIADLDHLNPHQPYEIIAGDLYVIHAPHWQHQRICGRISRFLDIWSEETQLGQVVMGPGVIFSEADNVIPDVVWVQQERLGAIVDEAGHLTAAPDLVVEVLSESAKDQVRDRQVKRKLYSSQGVQEYWIVDRFQKRIELYRRSETHLERVATLLATDRLTSPLLPNFSCEVALLFR
ncbi:Uma2 family endonuclease [Prochlorothrix hollandica]|uniref:Putative restriction endonuclease domain-containing protein n=1 Tax=Prochlorothrix hollandica PCC 9006 = CALU 1027 TaxID=317619 RepID=A0A0M2PUZ4_PROHO|nr:Uma2 family endonuclease [Prochlorothrix hollandica]KKI99948.1 hypothetical protein PROH_09140 [Prochlorothrix hollandica PCC 9006 = CALU 1027]KKI99949.1 hypothetical protein PROH_09145 [Prochlorothrix hollandica PCC 9006 = CALU 1027]